MAGLNPSQRAAVEHDDGPLLVLAGAGSGKTRVITHRIARMIARGTPPEAILAVSFTNKAAGEMVERLAKLTGPEAAARTWMSTFHSFGVRMLTEEAKHLDAEGKFVIFDQGDTLGLVRDLVRRERLGDRKLDAASILARISLWKNKFWAPHEVPERDYEYDAIARTIYPKYESALRAMRAVDFDDLVVVPVRLLRENPALRERWSERFHTLLVDEFQDTNTAQLELVRLLTNRRRNICVVGDDDQSIYGWRGAEVGNILDFERHFPGAKVVKLEDNYRSVAPILEVANAAMAAGQGKRHRKVLRAARGQGEKVQLCILDDDVAETRFVVSEIRRLHREKRHTWGDLAVLYRSNTQARLVEEELRVAGVPYRMLGGTQFFDRKEVKDAIAYLRVVVNPWDELSLRRVINHPPRGIGDTSVERIAAHAKQAGVPMSKVLAEIEHVEGLPDGARRGANALHQALVAARARFQQQRRLGEGARSLLEQVGLKNDLAEPEAGPSGAKRWENVEFLLRSIDRFETSEKEEKPSIAAFLARLLLRADQEKEETGQRVTLSTLHAAKGLEFRTVFLLGCVEGQLPHGRTTDPKANEAAPTDVEEERRLFYVAVTRAQDRLYICRPEEKSLRGKRIRLAPSRFLEGLPPESIEERRIKGEVTLGTDEIADMAKAFLDRLGAS